MPLSMGDDGIHLAQTPPILSSSPASASSTPQGSRRSHVAMETGSGRGETSGNGKVVVSFVTKMEIASEGERERERERERGSGG